MSSMDENLVKNLTDKIISLRKDLSSQHQRISDLEKKLDECNAYLNNHVKNNNEIFDDISGMLFDLWYKVFPGAVDANIALDRIRKEHTRRPSGRTST